MEIFQVNGSLINSDGEAVLYAVNGESTDKNLVLCLGFEDLYKLKNLKPIFTFYSPEINDRYLVLEKVVWENNRDLSAHFKYLNCTNEE
jgi:hypothetical protein